MQQDKSEQFDEESTSLNKENREYKNHDSKGTEDRDARRPLNAGERETSGDPAKDAAAALGADDDAQSEEEKVEIWVGGKN